MLDARPVPMASGVALDRGPSLQVVAFVVVLSVVVRDAVPGCCAGMLYRSQLPVHQLRSPVLVLGFSSGTSFITVRWSTCKAVADVASGVWMPVSSVCGHVASFRGDCPLLRW